MSVVVFGTIFVVAFFGIVTFTFSIAVCLQCMVVGKVWTLFKKSVRLSMVLSMFLGGICCVVAFFMFLDWNAPIGKFITVVLWPCIVATLLIVTGLYAVHLFARLNIFLGTKLGLVKAPEVVAEPVLAGGRVVELPTPHMARVD